MCETSRSMKIKETKENSYKNKQKNSVMETIMLRCSIDSGRRGKGILLHEEIQLVSELIKGDNYKYIKKTCINKWIFFHWIYTIHSNRWKTNRFTSTKSERFMYMENVNKKYFD